MKHPNQNPAVQLLIQFCKHYSERNLDGMLSLFCNEHGVHLWGSGLDEDRHGLEEIKQQAIRDWEQSEKSILIPPSEFYFSEGAPNWAAGNFKAEVTIKGETMKIPLLRGSICAVQESDGWKISHMHASFPAQDQEVGNSFPNS